VLSRLGRYRFAVESGPFASVVRAMRRHPAEGLAAVVGVAVGALSSSFASGFSAFVVAVFVFEAGFRLWEGLVLRASGGAERLVKTQLRRAGIAAPGIGGGDLSSAPVLVIRRSLNPLAMVRRGVSESYKQEVFEQDGRLLAVGRLPQRSGLSQLRHLWESELWTFSTPAGHPIVTVTGDVSRGRFTAADAEGHEIGSVVTTGRKEASIYAGERVVGLLMRPRRTGFRLQRARPDYILYDESRKEVGRVSSLGAWSLIGVDSQVGQPLRRLLLAVPAVIHSWRPRGGGG
jgi:hypothetical protein